jgi:prevent-host-death family protein
MVTVGVRELKHQVSSLLRLVREEGEMVEITYRGEPVARLVPVNAPAPAPEEMAAILTDLEQLSAEISAKWPDGVSALDAVNDVRRDL